MTQSNWVSLVEHIIWPVTLTWEHATWITATDLTDGMLRDAVQADFVALLGPSRRFERLVDRRSLLEEMGIAAVRP